MLIFVEFFKKFFGDEICAHFRLEVIGCNVWRSDEIAVFVFITSLDASVKEESYVGIFFGFCNAELFESFFCNVFAKGIFKNKRREGDFYVFKGFVILRHANVADFFCGSFKSCKFFVNNCAGHFSCTVGTEVCKDDGIAVFDACIFFTDEGNDELIGYAFVIALLNSFCGVVNKFCITKDKCFVMALNAVPALVTIHAVISSADGCNFSNTGFIKFCLKFFDIAFSGRRRNVAAIHKAMEINF